MVPAADALIYQKCSVNFKKGDSIPKKHQHDIPNEQIKLAGRPSDKNKEDAFLEICRWLKENDEPISVQELLDKMAELLPEDIEPDIMILRQKDGANMIVLCSPDPSSLIWLPSNRTRTPELVNFTFPVIGGITNTSEPVYIGRFANGSYTYIGNVHTDYYVYFSDITSDNGDAYGGFSDSYDLLIHAK
ncbi:unnamed protein product [Phaedon cochleariae]|uniref:Uncharacterized protein n=1 Tax=Phaedon cochleariae TaxID=80249 RepID=A0A9N9SKV3_PHACE|nr:unnamed protein product [Phaedon cochleariae]